MHLVFEKLQQACGMRLQRVNEMKRALVLFVLVAACGESASERKEREAWAEYHRRERARAQAAQEEHALKWAAWQEQRRTCLVAIYDETANPTYRAQCAAALHEEQEAAQRAERDAQRYWQVQAEVEAQNQANRERVQGALDRMAEQRRHDEAIRLQREQMELQKRQEEERRRRTVRCEPSYGGAVECREH